MKKNKQNVRDLWKAVKDTTQRGFPGGSVGKNPPAIQETQETRFNPLEKAMAMHSSILAWEIPQTEEPGKLLVHGYKSQT